MDNFNNFKETGVLNFFKSISKIPRCSHNESEIASYIYNFGKDLGFDVKRDAFNNVLIIKPASYGYEDHEPLVLQAHTDMVCEKEANCIHDFNKDGINLIVNGDIIRASGTTLGADDGIGVAIIMDILSDKELKAPKIEALFTATEETGMDGAIGLSETWLTGRNLINVDTEDDNIIIVGCAGGVNAIIDLDLKFETYQNQQNFELEIQGLKGGHSGLTIGDSHINAIKLMNEVVMKLRLEEELNISYIDGGTKHNAIPTSCKYIIGVSKDRSQALIDHYSQITSETIEKNLKREADIKFSIRELSDNDKYIEKDVATRILRLIQLFPHGVSTMNDDDDLVVSSNNLATVRTESDKIKINTSLRSSSEKDLTNLRNKVVEVSSLSGAKIEFSDGYPMWEPNFKSDLLRIAKDVYKSMRGELPEVATIHAGLETGIISKKYPGINMISIGPNIRGAHTPEENLSIDSTNFTTEFLKETINRL